MIYERESLDRKTGELHTLFEEWITITELGKRYSTGPKKTRAVLYHMGVLQPENGRYRLNPDLVAKGLGLRHEKPKSGYPFDVLSPLCQTLIDAAWEYTLVDQQNELLANRQNADAKAALESFKLNRNGSMTSQMEVCWLLDHYPHLTHQDIADLTDITRQAVSQFAERQGRQRRIMKQQKQEFSLSLLAA